MIRSTELRRHTRLRPGKSMRRTWLKWRSPRRIARETEAEKLHKRAVREMRICAASKYAGSGRCSGGLEVAHLGASGGVGRKHGDWTETTMLCRQHHRALDQRLAPFSEISADELLAWKDREIALAREFVAGRQAVAA